MIKIKYPKNIEENYYKLIAHTRMKKFNNSTFESYYNSNIKSKLSGYELRALLCGEYEKLLEIKDDIGSKYSSKSNIIKKLFNYDKSSKSLELKLSKLQPKISNFFESQLEIYTCNFCNIEFINKFKTTNGKFKNGFTLDHYIDKGSYPFLSLSLYNLIPSCYVCNSKVKGMHQISSLSPSSNNFDFDEKVKFKTFIKNRNLLVEKEDDFELLLKEHFSKEEYKSYIDILNLDGRYEYHKYKVIEMINKRKEYPDSRISELAKLIEKTEQEVKRDIFGKYLPDELHKRPLSKLIKDISKELGLT